MVRHSHLSPVLEAVLAIEFQSVRFGYFRQQFQDLQVQRRL